ncbi:MAG: rod-binding protein [Phycisphaeraceae bacterium]
MMSATLNTLDIPPHLQADAPTSAITPGGAGAPGFVESLAAARTAADGMDEASPVDARRDSERLREAAEQLIASAFIMPMLAQMRNSTLGSDLMHGGTAEDMFKQQLDTHLSEGIARGSSIPLVDAVEQFIAKRVGLDPTTTPATPATIPATPNREIDTHG